MSGLFVDLHTHSTVSDGTDTPEKLVANAAACGLAAIALTDHDTTEGVLQAQKAAKEWGIECISGCEYAVMIENEEIHLVGLWAPHSSKPLQAALLAARQYRMDRNFMIIEKLQALGIDISIEDVAACAQGESVGRPHIASALQQKKYIKTSTEAFETYLGWQKPAFVPRTLTKPEEGIRLLAEEGATVVLAHPMLSKKMTKERLDDLLSDFKKWGLSAVEVYHSRHRNDAVRITLELAQKHDLLISGGSDYHGTTKPNVHLGIHGLGGRVPMLYLDKMKEHRRRAGLWV